MPPPCPPVPPPRPTAHQKKRVTANLLTAIDFTRWESESTSNQRLHIGRWKERERPELHPWCWAGTHHLHPKAALAFYCYSKVMLTRVGVTPESWSTSQVKQRSPRCPSLVRMSVRRLRTFEVAAEFAEFRINASQMEQITTFL